MSDEDAKGENNAEIHLLDSMEGETGKDWIRFITHEFKNAS